MSSYLGKDKGPWKYTRSCNLTVRSKTGSELNGNLMEINVCPKRPPLYF